MAVLYPDALSLAQQRESSCTVPCWALAEPQTRPSLGSLKHPRASSASCQDTSGPAALSCWACWEGVCGSGKRAGALQTRVEWGLREAKRGRQGQGTSEREPVLLVLAEAGAQGPGAECQLPALPVTVSTSCWGLHSASCLGACFWFSCLDYIQTLFLKNLWFSRDLKPLTSCGRLLGGARPTRKGPRVN